MTITVGTLFTSSHTDFGPGFDEVQDIIDSIGEIEFYLSVNGGAFNLTNFETANNNNLSLTGTSFSFRQAASNPTFYVGALVTQDPIPPEVVVPIPPALPLFLSAVAGLGLISRRRMANTAT